MLTKVSDRLMRQLNRVAHATIWQLWRGSKKTSLVLVGVLGILLSTQAVHAATIYDFVESSTTDVLARISLQGDEPWDHSDILSLVFTQAGDDKLVLGVGTYGGAFDTTGNAFIMHLASDGLIGDGGAEGMITDNTPPTGASNVTLLAGTIGNTDRISVEGRARVASGDWKLVPEPGSLGLAVMAMVGWGSYRCRRDG